MGNGPKDVQWVPGEPSGKGHNTDRKKLLWDFFNGWGLEAYL